MTQGSENGLGDVAGIRLAHVTDVTACTGCTLVLARQGATAGVDVRGLAAATHRTDLLRPWATVDRVQAILLTGGSAFGLEAAAGVVDVLEKRGIGFSFGNSVVPIVPAAALFDLQVGDPTVRPTRQWGERVTRRALEADEKGDPTIEEGNVGAGTGASVGKVFGMASASKGGLGAACHCFPDGTQVGAVAVVNAFGDVIDPETGKCIAGCRRGDGLQAHKALLAAAGGTILDRPVKENTTLVVVATDLDLTKSECTVVARMAHNGLARTIVPVHTPVDGDVVFALSTCKRRRIKTAPHLTMVGYAAAHVTQMAILRGVRQAKSLGGLPGLG